MTELLQAAVLPPNLLPTGLLVFVVLYWLTVMIGLVGADSLDVDIHHDLPDAGHHHFGPDGGLGTDWLNNALAFFNLGRVPLMFWLSFVALPLWVGSILTNYLLHNSSLLIGLVLLLPLLFGSLFLAKILTLPFVKLFAALEKDHDAGAQAVGKVCTVVLPATHELLGQASIRLSDGAPLVLNVKALSPTATFRKGDQALVIDFDPRRRCYLIEPY
jgi:phosphoglycerol transferase MdoB-like AlkP superfamily enzyme